MFSMIVKFQEILSTDSNGSKSSKEIADLTIFSCISSHISRLTQKYHETRPKVVIVSYDVLDNCKVSRNSINRIWFKVQIWQEFR